MGVTISYANKKQKISNYIDNLVQNINENSFNCENDKLTFMNDKYIAVLSIKKNFQNIFKVMAVSNASNINTIDKIDVNNFNFNHKFLFNSNQNSNFNSNVNSHKASFISNFESPPKSQNIGKMPPRLTPSNKEIIKKNIQFSYNHNPSGFKYLKTYQLKNKQNIIEDMSAKMEKYIGFFQNLKNQNIVKIEEFYIENNIKKGGKVARLIVLEEYNEYVTLKDFLENLYYDSINSKIDINTVSRIN